VLGEVPLTDVGIVTLKLCEEFVRGWEAAVLFSDTWDPIDDELAEAIITDEVEEPCGEFV
jgi:hypothetical protein